MSSIDIMLDLETTGVSAGCCILSIGAVTLDEKFKFYEKISIDSCYNAGLKDFAGTRAWWNKQSPEARREAFSGTESLTTILGAFSDWFKSVERQAGGDAFIWGNGADFDLPILKAAYEAAGMEEPWKSFNGRCYRTLKNLKENKTILAEKFEGMKHNALDDAIHQARYMMKILRSKKQIEMFQD